MPGRLSKGAGDSLPWLRGAFGFGRLLTGLQADGAQSATVLSNAVGLLTVILLIIGAWTLTLGAGRGDPMKHALAGLAHLAFHPRPERFSRNPSSSPSALRPLDLERNEMGAGKPSGIGRASCRGRVGR